MNITFDLFCVTYKSWNHFWSGSKPQDKLHIFSFPSSLQKFKLTALRSVCVFIQTLKKTITGTN